MAYSLKGNIVHDGEEGAAGSRSHIVTHKQEAKRANANGQKSSILKTCSCLHPFFRRATPPQPRQTVLQTGDHVFKYPRMGWRLIQSTTGISSSSSQLSLFFHVEIISSCPPGNSSSFESTRFIGVFLVFILSNASPSGSGRF